MQLPIVHRNPRNHMPIGKHPSFPDKTVFNPQFRIAGGQQTRNFGVLNKHGRMWLDLALHDRPLVAHKILHRQRRRNQFPACTIMIKLAARQRQDSDSQCIQLFVNYTRMSPKSKTELRIQVVFLHLFPVRIVGMFHQQFHRPVTEQPDAYIHQKKMRTRQPSQLIESRLLKHEIKLVRRFTIRHENPVASGQCRIHPQTITDNICFRNLLQRFAVTQVNIATGNQRMQRIRCFAHDFLVQRELK